MQIPVFSGAVAHPEDTAAAYKGTAAAYRIYPSQLREDSTRPRISLTSLSTITSAEVIRVGSTAFVRGVLDVGHIAGGTILDKEKGHRGGAPPA
jgi:hypothetical protein